MVTAYLAAMAMLPPGLLEAVEHVESRGRWDAVSSSGCVGVMQVQPRYALAPRWALFLPSINRAEGARMLAYWHRRSGGDWPRALAGYRCGNAGLRGECGAAYAQHVLALAKGYRRAQRGVAPGGSRRQHHLPPTNDGR